MKPNAGIFQDGFDAAFLRRASPIDNNYGTLTCDPHLNFERWSWLCGYVEGLRSVMEAPTPPEDT